MFQRIYEWLREICIFLVLTTAVLHALPGDEYKKYVRFFTGLVLILMAIGPVLSLFGEDSPVLNFYKGRQYEEKLEEMEREAQSLYGAGEETITQAEEEVLTQKEEALTQENAFTQGDTVTQAEEEKKTENPITVGEIQID